MPIFDQSYRAYTGAHTRRWDRLAAIVAAGMRAPLKKRAFWFLMLWGSVPFLVQFVRLYLMDYASAFGIPTNFGRGVSILPRSTGADFFMDFLLQQPFPFSLKFILLVITLYVGSGLVADDLAAGALPLYLSRPIGRVDYIAGKLLPIMLYGALVMLLPAMALWLLLVTKAMGGGEPPPLVVGLQTISVSLVVLLGYASVMLAISSLTKSRRTAGITFAILFIVSDRIAAILERLLSNPTVTLVSFSKLFNGVGHLLLGVPAKGADWLPLAQTGILVAYIAGSFLILSRRVRQGSGA